MGDLTKNFSLDEFTQSDTAEKLGIANMPTSAALIRLKHHATIMQEVRDIVGRAILLTNGYRNARVNKAVGGVPGSDHMHGDASDGRAAGLTAFGYASIIAREMKKGGRLFGKIDQLILESSRNVVHLSTAPRLRGQVMTQKGGAGTPLVPGLQP